MSLLMRSPRKPSSLSGVVEGRVAFCFESPRSVRPARSLMTRKIADITYTRGLCHSLWWSLLLLLATIVLTGLLFCEVPQLPLDSAGPPAFTSSSSFPGTPVSTRGLTMIHLPRKRNVLHALFSSWIPSSFVVGADAIIITCTPLGSTLMRECYYLLLAVTWDEVLSGDLCQYAGGFFSPPMSAAEEAAVIASANHGAHYPLRRVDTSNSNTPTDPANLFSNMRAYTSDRVSTGTSILPFYSTYVNFPTNYGDYATSSCCSSVQYTGGSNKLRDRSCSTYSNYFICRAKECRSDLHCNGIGTPGGTYPSCTCTCPPSGIYYGPQCQYFDSEGDVFTRYSTRIDGTDIIKTGAKTYADAKTFCEAQPNSALLTIKSAAQWAAVTGGNPKGFWLGASETAADSGVFEWTAGWMKGRVFAQNTTFLPPYTFMSWKPSEPSGGSAEHAISFSENSQINDLDGTEQQGVICVKHKCSAIDDCSGNGVLTNIGVAYYPDCKCRCFRPYAGAQCNRIGTRTSTATFTESRTAAPTNPLSFTGTETVSWSGSVSTTQTPSQGTPSISTSPSRGSVTLSRSASDSVSLTLSATETRSRPSLSRGTATGPTLAASVSQTLSNTPPTTGTVSVVTQPSNTATSSAPLSQTRTAAASESAPTPTGSQRPSASVLPRPSATKTETVSPQPSFTGRRTLTHEETTTPSLNGTLTLSPSPTFAAPRTISKQGTLSPQARTRSRTHALTIVLRVPGPTPEPDPPLNPDTVAPITGTILLSGTLVGITDTAQSLQLAAIFALMSCKVPSTGNDRLRVLMSPLNLGGRIGYLLGGFALAVQAMMIYCTLFAIVAAKKGLEWASGKLAFPSPLPVILGFFYTGVCYEACVLLYGNGDPNATELALGALFLALCVLVVVWYHYVIFAFRNDVQVAAYTAEEVAAVPRPVAMLLLPRTYYARERLQSAFCVASALRPGFLQATVSHQLLRSLLIAAVGAITTDDEDACRVVRIVIACVCFVHGVFVLAMRAYRVPVVSGLQAAQSVLLGLIALTEFTAIDPQVISLMLSIVSLLTITAVIVVIVIEFRLRQARQARMQLTDISKADGEVAVVEKNDTCQTDGHAGGIAEAGFVHAVLGDLDINGGSLSLSHSYRAGGGGGARHRYSPTAVMSGLISPISPTRAGESSGGVAGGVHGALHGPLRHSLLVVEVTGAEGTEAEEESGGGRDIGDGGGGAASAVSSAPAGGGIGSAAMLSVTSHEGSTSEALLVLDGRLRNRRRSSEKGPGGRSPRAVVDGLEPFGHGSGRHHRLHGTTDNIHLDGEAYALRHFSLLDAVTSYSFAEAGFSQTDPHAAPHDAQPHAISAVSAPELSSS